MRRPSDLASRRCAKSGKPDVSCFETRPLMRRYSREAGVFLRRSAPSRFPSRARRRRLAPLPSAPHLLRTVRGYDFVEHRYAAPADRPPLPRRGFLGNDRQKQKILSPAAEVERGLAAVDCGRTVARVV